MRSNILMICLKIFCTLVHYKLITLLLTVSMTNGAVSEIKIGDWNDAEDTYFKVQTGNFGRHKNEKSIKTDTINIHAHINTISFTSNSISENHDLFIYLYAMYSKYSKTWVQEIVRNDTSGAYSISGALTLCYDSSISTPLIIVPKVGRRDKNGELNTVAHNIKSLNVSFSASRSSIKVNLGEDNNVTVSTETPYRLAAVQDVSKEGGAQDRFLILKVDSITNQENDGDDLCMIVAVYGMNDPKGSPACPLLKDKIENIYSAQMWTRALAKATLTIDMENPAFQNGFYGTILLLQNNSDCYSGTLSYSDTKLDVTARNFDSIARQNRKVQAKKLRVQVHRSINCNQYLIAIFHGLAFILLIVIFVLVIFTCRKFEVQHELTCRTENEEISSISRRVGVDSKPVDVVDSPTDTLPPKEGKVLKHVKHRTDVDSSSRADKDKSEFPDSDRLLISIRNNIDLKPEDSVDGVTLRNKPPKKSARSEARKERIKSALMSFTTDATLSDMARISEKDTWFRRNRSRVYAYLVPLLTLYYFVPAIQISILSKQPQELIGSRDLCYHNFRCSRPYYIFSDFNHIISNLGYALFGLAFNFLVWEKGRKFHRIQKEIEEGSHQPAGIPQQLGIFYAMGYALVAQSLFSVCYHSCPTNLSLQFDTTMMYVICVLCYVKIYQFRHPDTTANAFSIFALLGVVILLEALLLHFDSWFTHAIFLVFYISMVIFVSFDTYYNGIGRIDITVAWLLASDILKNSWKAEDRHRQSIAGTQSSNQLTPKNCTSFLRFPYRFFFALLFLFTNLAYAAFTVYEKLGKSRTKISHVLLVVFVLNLNLYLFYYTMRAWFASFIRKHRQELNEGQCCNFKCCGRFAHVGLFFTLLSYACGIFGFYFYRARSTNRNASPAESQNLNVECSVLNFFDNHDVWHFFSGAAVFFRFTALLVFDDNLVNVERSKIPVF